MNNNRKNIKCNNIDNIIYYKYYYKYNKFKL